MEALKACSRSLAAGRDAGAKTPECLSASQLLRTAERCLLSLAAVGVKR